MMAETFFSFFFVAVMYPAYAKWVQSHRDLPIKLNQWCNVVVSLGPFTLNPVHLDE